MEHTIGIIGAERIRVFRSMDPVRPNIREKLNIHITNTTLTESRIIGWGIRFKLQMLCPQEDE